jgi:hypothetical protein
MGATRAGCRLGVRLDLDQGVFMFRLPASLLVSLALVSALAACNQGKGRIDPYSTTKEEKAEEKVLTTALLEFSDQVPEVLIQNLYDLPQIRDTPGKVLVLIGDFNNKTGNVPTTDFEMVAQRLRNKLINSGTASNKLTFVEKRRRIERLSDEEKVVGADGQPAEAPAYQAETTYLLLGDFYRTKRADANLYYMQFQLVSTATNAIVFSDDYTVKQPGK